MLTQLPLPALPAGAAEIAPGVGLAVAADGGLVWVHGLATVAWDSGDEAGRRLAAVQLVRLRAASQAAVAAAFGVDPVTIWRWDQALCAAGVAGLIPDRKGPRRASRLTAGVVARIAELDAAGHSLPAIARTVGVSTFSVRNALGRVAARPASQAGGPAGEAGEAAGERRAAGVAGDEPAVSGAGPDAVEEAAVLPVLPDPVSRDGERVIARWGLLGEAAPVFAPGARYPLAGLLLALPALEAAGLLDCARQVYGRLRSGFYGLETMLVTLVFLALLGEPRAEGATRVRPARWAGCWAWTGRRRSRRSAASSPSWPPPGGRASW